MSNGNSNQLNVIASLGDDITFIPQVNHYTGSEDEFVWFAFDDRKLYKPKEEVRVKGYLR